MDASIEQAGRLDQYMRTKCANQELYDWCVRQISSVYFDAFKLAYGMAKQAEQCYIYELGVNDSTSSPGFISQTGYWDNLRSGLMAGELLAHGIRRMEAAHMDKECALIRDDPERVPGSDRPAGARQPPRDAGPHERRALSSRRPSSRG